MKKKRYKKIGYILPSSKEYQAIFRGDVECEPKEPSWDWEASNLRVEAYWKCRREDKEKEEEEYERYERSLQPEYYDSDSDDEEGPGIRLCDVNFVFPHQENFDFNSDGWI